MLQDTFQTIQKLSNERFQLYRLAGHHGVTPNESARIEELTSRLAVLWDQHRRELASGSRDIMERVATLRPEVRQDLPEEERRAA